FADSNRPSAPNVNVDSLKLHPNAFVFVSERGSVMTADNFLKLMAKLGKQAGFTFKCHPHQLRHGAGYQLVNAGVSTRTIQAYLGHKNIKHTEYKAECGRIQGPRAQDWWQSLMLIGIQALSWCTQPLKLTNRVKHVSYQNRPLSYAVHLVQPLLAILIILNIFSHTQCLAQTAIPENCVPERLLVPGGVATHDGSIGFFPAVDSGIVALRLSDGKQLWKTESAQLPAGVIGRLLVALSDDLKVHVFGPKGHETFVSEPLPARNEGSLEELSAANGIQESVRNRAVVETCCSGKSLIVKIVHSWYIVANGPAPRIGSALLTFSVDQGTGKVNEAPTVSSRGWYVASDRTVLNPPESFRSLESEIKKASLVPGLRNRLLTPTPSSIYLPLTHGDCKVRILGNRVIYLAETAESVDGTEAAHAPSQSRIPIPTMTNIFPGRAAQIIRRFVVMCDAESGKELWRCEIAGFKVPAQPAQGLGS
ncbi:MAG: tyrosine-type recombinase/integrase, partial [Ktedonobacteraceae bacterium]